MARSADLATASRASILTLRRVERQQRLIEVLHRVPRRSSAELARDLDVSERTLSRDIARLRESGVPLVTTPGHGGGVSLAHGHRIEPIAFDLAEVAALISSLAELGPTATESSSSAMRKLVGALRAHPSG